MTQGGASGAFFFYSRDEIFIAKSCTKNEFQVLLDNATQFKEYYESQEGQQSLISKVFIEFLNIFFLDL